MAVHHSCRFYLLVPLCLAWLQSLAAENPGPNPLHVEIGSGPRTGNYAAPGTETICLHVQGQQYSAGYKDFSGNPPTSLSEAGISVTNPDEAGPWRGEVRVAFSDADKQPQVYDIQVPADSAGPLEFSRHPDGVELAFRGVTRDGVQLRLTAICTDIEEF